MEVLIVLKDNHLGVCLVSRKNLAGPGGGPYSPERQSLGVCLVSKKNLAGPGGGPYSPERQSPRSLLGL